MEPAFYRINWHFSYPFIGFLMALNGILIALIEMVMIHNLEGRRPGLVYVYTGVFIGAAGFILLNVIPPTAVTAIMIVVLITFSEMLCMPFMNSFWIHRSKDHNRGQYAGLYSMSWSAAQIIAPFMGGRLIDHGGFSLLWWVLAGLSLISGLGYLFLYRYTIRTS
ncbi:major facilitator superfamily protein [mine drainage metagenome]|uniref:Major facilitator superfamily protein n=1 Tax=mine drainage metagenome TaxID=410659 RepID=A0A1J5PKZ7_9ZZZZ